MTAGQPQEVELAPDHSRCWVHFSHLSYGDFGRTETLAHWNIAKLFESGFHFACATEVLNLQRIVNQQYTVFFMGLHYKMNPELWTVPLGTVFPYKISLEVSDVGRTSMTLYSELVNKLDNKTLASAHYKLVYVDRVKRRPVPFPDWYTEMFTAVVERQKRPLTLQLTFPAIPQTAHCYDLEVAASDMDINGHTNQASYVRYCCDAAQAAIRAQAVSGFQQDIARYPLIEQEVIYMGESHMGDRLQVITWQQQADQPEKLSFVIRRQNSGRRQPAVILQAYMIFQMMKQVPQLARM